MQAPVRTELGWRPGCIAATGSVPARTVRKHLENVYRKLGTHDRLQTVTVARRHGLLPPF